MAKIPNFSKTQLRYGAHFAVMTSFDEKVALVAEGESMLTGAYNEFKSALGYEDDAIKIARASEYSHQILTADSARDRLYNNGKATSEMWVALGVEPMATAASAVLREYNNYKVDTTAQYDQETGIMYNFLQPFEDNALKAHLQTLGLTAVFEQMKIANEEMRRLISLRGEERATNAAYKIKQARLATDAAYDKLCDRINALQTLDETGKYDSFIAWWSQEIARIKQQILNQKPGTAGDASNGGSTTTNEDENQGGESGSNENQNGSSGSSSSSGSSDSGSGSGTGTGDNGGGGTTPPGDDNDKAAED